MSESIVTKAILFDYGSVIEGPLDQAGFEADLAALAQRYGFSTGQELWNHLYVCDAWEQAKRGQMTREEYWIERLAALGIHDQEQRELFKVRLHRNRGILAEMPPLLRELRERYRLAVISNTSRRNLGEYLAIQRGLDGLFDVVVSSADAGIAKPDPKIYQMALQLMGIAPQEALFIDDLERNTLAAEALGIPSIVFTTPQALRDELAHRGIL
jgi:epoxide hydrolase-like predicted phosphatase